MDLFECDSGLNLLPYDGVVNYYGPIFGEAEAASTLNVMMRVVPWQHDEVVMFGKRVVTARKVAWYGDGDYTYSGTVKKAVPWSQGLLMLKEKVEELSGESFNSCLMNLYHHGGEGMGWHSDDEKELEKDAAIASVSFGAERKFCLKHKQTHEQVSLMLENGSLLMMKGTVQTHWLHALPKMAKVKEPRINLTFRKLAG